MKLRIDGILDAFTKWQEAAQKSKKADGTKGVEAHNAERVAAHELQTEVENFLEKSGGERQLSETLPSYPSFLPPAPIPKCTCGHLRVEHRAYRYECGDVSNGPCSCQHYTKTLERERA